MGGIEKLGEIQESGLKPMAGPGNPGGSGNLAGIFLSLFRFLSLASTCCLSLFLRNVASKGSEP